MSTIFSFFGLRENPFKINPDPRFLYATDQTRAASDELAYAISTRKGLILLTGEVGTGKTMLIRGLLDWLTEQKMPTALIFNSHIQPEHLLDFILNDFGVACTSTSKSEKLMALNRWLLERYRAGQTPVLIVDEAQGLDPAALEEIRLLLNFETPREKLLQIVLAGQPELQVKLKRHELRQLRQRITVRCTTAPLTLEQTYGYIRERLRIAGANGQPIFEPDAVGALHAYSRGIPRVINVLAEHSLINACAEDATTVSASAVELAALDCQLDRADSVARILNTGSYSTANLSDIGALLASISANSDSPAGPTHKHQFIEAPPAARNAVFHPAQPSPQAVQVHNAVVACNQVEVNAVENDLEQNFSLQSWTATADVSQAPEVPPLPEVVSVQTAVAAYQALPAESVAGPSPSSLHFLQLWGRSFLADVRSSSRQLRRALRLFETHRLNPFIRDVRRQLHQFRVRASRLPSHPRWKQFRARVGSASRTSWISFTSAMPPWLARPLGMNSHVRRRRAQSAVASRVKRRRSILTLRKWLHEPLTTQQKRTQGNQG
jgi:type II secretory pathway predicted ATPase ExeA